MRRLVTYNFKKSNCSGGIESLIREIQKLSISKGLDVIELYCDGDENELYGENDKVKYIRVNCTVGNKLRRVLLSRIEFFKLGLKRGDVVVIFNPIYLMFIPFISLYRAKIILVQSTRLDVLFSSFISRSVMRLLGRFVNYFTVYTESDSSEIKLIFPELINKVEVIPRGCRLPIYNGLRKRSNRLVTIARIDNSVKNFEAMVRVLEILPESFTLDIYGDGSEVEVKSLLALIESQPNIKYLGAASNVSEVLSDYSIFIMTSKYEGFGQTLIEASSQGLPVVLFDTFPNASWVVKNGVTGYLITPWNYESFSQSIQYLVSSDEVYNEFSRLSLDRSKEFNMDNINKLWLRLIS